MEVIEVIYEKGVLRPLKKKKFGKKTFQVKIVDMKSIAKKTFGMLKGKNIDEIMRDVENEWGIY